jgi:AraC-like DNA-binding protein
MIYTSIILIILISIFLLNNQWKNNKGVLFLIFGLVFVGIRYLTFFLIFNQLEIRVLTAWFLHTDPLSCLIGPAFYFYLRSLLINKRAFRAYDLGHLIPAILVAINTMPYYLLPFEEKFKALSLILSSPVVSGDALPHLLFSYRLQKGLPTIINIAYLLFIFYRFKSKGARDIYICKNGPQLINRILLIFLINLFSSVFLVFFVTLNSSLNSTNWLFIFSQFSSGNKALLYFMSLILPISVFFSPQLLFFKASDSRNDMLIDTKGPFFLKSKRPNVEPNNRDSEDLKRILLYIDQKKPYLNTKLSLHEITRELNIPHARVTFCFNRILRTPFPIYKNKLRVSHAESMMRDGAHLTMTIEGIGVKSGFKSISVFYAAFREVHGMTPAEWIKEKM